MINKPGGNVNDLVLLISSSYLPDLKLVSHGSVFTNIIHLKAWIN